VVGFRAFLRWELERSGEVVRAVRAVDTATDPSHQRQGIFSRLTRHALAELTAAGVAFVFNTPNDKSRPGYLKMGWREVGRVPVGVRPSGLRGIPRLAAARGGGGERWSRPSTAGVAAPELLADTDGVAALLASQPGGDDALRTRRSPAYLAWRYGFEPLAYRAVPAGEAAAEGFVILRVRSRGGAAEAAVCEVLVPGGDAGAARRVLARAAGEVEADYLSSAGSGRMAAGFVPVPGQGPLLVWRALTETDMPTLASWSLSLGDLELF